MKTTKRIFATLLVALLGLALLSVVASAAPPPLPPPGVCPRCWVQIDVGGQSLCCGSVFCTWRTLIIPPLPILRPPVFQPPFLIDLSSPIEMSIRQPSLVLEMQPIGW